eukprot:TRINITY_DN5833_c0_g1_i1.p1 TRINITY_DN5833_c0_g1~~TRINITY_DN5833_c0_g1_i1.p1  ORF type:complete len:286 (+),score=75.74 TRINITY_DN5833_c0_g1_i1:62-919(+)
MGDFIISVFSLHNLVDLKSNHYVDVRLVGEFGRAQMTPKVKGNANPVFNVNYKFRVRKQDIKVRFEIVKPGTFSDTSLGVVEVATGALLPAVPSDMWLQFGTTGIQLHVAILYVPDAQFQRDLIIQKATQASQSGDLGVVISTGGSGILNDVGRAIDPAGQVNNRPAVVVVQQQPQMVVVQQQQPQPLQPAQPQPMVMSTGYVMQQPQPQPQQQPVMMMHHSNSQPQLYPNPQYVVAPQQQQQQQPMMYSPQPVPGQQQQQPMYMQPQPQQQAAQGYVPPHNLSQ